MQAAVQKTNPSKPVVAAPAAPTPVAPPVVLDLANLSKVAGGTIADPTSPKGTW